MIIDIHTHILDPKEGQGIAAEPDAKTFSLTWLLEQQEQAGVDLSIVSHPALVERTLAMAPSSILKAVQAYDDFAADLAQRHTGHLAALAVTYPFGGDPFLKELERAVKELGLKGVLISSRYAGEFLDSPRATPFLELACQLDIPVSIHPPMETIGAQFMREFRLVPMVGRPFETTLTLARLIYYGVLERFPELKIVAAHVGGGIMMLSGRLDYGYETRSDESLGVWGPNYLKARPGQYLKRIYVDTMTPCPSTPLRFAVP